MQGFKRLEMVSGGSVVGGKVNGFISCKMNFCPHSFQLLEVKDNMLKLVTNQGNS